MNMQFFPNHFKPKPQIIRQIPIIMLGKGNPSSPEINCLNCGKRGHSMQSCYALKPVAAPMSAPLTEIAEPVLQNQHFQIPNSYSTTVNEQYIPFCAEVTIRTTEGTQRPVTLLRNTGAMQSLVSRKRFQPFEYVDTSENRLTHCH